MSEMSTVKTIAIFAIIFGCFAILYPKLFHPMLLNMFGMGERNKKEDFSNYVPPSLTKPNMGKPRSINPAMAGHDSMKQGMRGPHPGMRAAAEMAKQGGGGGGGRGMMGVVLPIYAIGIVLYLVYTLTKVFSGRKKANEQDVARLHREDALKTLSNIRYNAEKNRFMVGNDESEEDDIVTTRQAIRKQKDLERLLLKADKDKISDLEMKELKRRLAETESQMARILEAMSGIQEKSQGLVERDEESSNSAQGGDGFHASVAEDEEEAGEVEEEIQYEDDYDDDDEEEREAYEQFNNFEDSEGDRQTDSSTDDESDQYPVTSSTTSNGSEDEEVIKSHDTSTDVNIRKRVQPSPEDDAQRVEK